MVGCGWSGHRHHTRTTYTYRTELYWYTRYMYFCSISPCNYTTMKRSTSRSIRNNGARKRALRRSDHRHAARPAIRARQLPQCCAALSRRYSNATQIRQCPSAHAYADRRRFHLAHGCRRRGSPLQLIHRRSEEGPAIQTVYARVAYVKLYEGKTTRSLKLRIPISAHVLLRVSVCRHFRSLLRDGFQLPDGIRWAWNGGVDGERCRYRPSEGMTC